METSSENTDSVSIDEDHRSTALTKVEIPTASDIQVTSLQNRIEKVEESRNEERWYIVAGICLLVDLLQFPDMGAVQATLVFVLELVVLLVLAEKWGVDNVQFAMRQVGGLIRDIRGGKTDDGPEEKGG